MPSGLDVEHKFVNNLIRLRTKTTLVVGELLHSLCSEKYLQLLLIAVQWCDNETNRTITRNSSYHDQKTYCVATVD